MGIHGNGYMLPHVHLSDLIFCVSCRQYIFVFLTRSAPSVHKGARWSPRKPSCASRSSWRQHVRALRRPSAKHMVSCSVWLHGPHRASNRSSHPDKQQHCSATTVWMSFRDNEGTQKTQAERQKCRKYSTCRNIVNLPLITTLNYTSFVLCMFCMMYDLLYAVYMYVYYTLVQYVTAWFCPDVTGVAIGSHGNHRLTVLIKGAKNLPIKANTSQNIYVKG